MKFKIGDKVTILLVNPSSIIKRYIGDATSGTIIDNCPVVDCRIVKLNNGRKDIVHLLIHDMALAIKKNQQLEFSFTETR